MRAACRQKQRGGSRADLLETLHFIRAGLPAKGGRGKKKGRKREEGRREAGRAGWRAGCCRMKGCCKLPNSTLLIPSLLCQAGLTARVTSLRVSPTPDLPFLLSSPPGLSGHPLQPWDGGGTRTGAWVGDLAESQGGAAEPIFCQVLLDYTHHLVTTFREEGGSREPQSALRVTVVQTLGTAGFC